MMSKNVKKTSEIRQKDSLSGSFWAFWSGQTVSSLFDPMQTIAITLWAFNSHGVATASVLLVIQTLSRAAGIFSAGALVDRYGPLPLLRLATWLRIPVTLAVAWSLSSSGLALVSCTLLLVGFFSGSSSTAYRATIPRIVPENSLSRANALWESATQFNSIVGASLGGLLYVVIGVQNVALLNAASYAFALVGAYIVTSARTPRAATSSLISDSLEGFRYVLTQPWLLWLLGFDAVLDMATAGVLALGIPAHAITIGSTGVVGILIGAFGLGSIVGAQIAARKEPSSARVIQVVCASNIVQAPLLAAIPFAGQYLDMTLLVTIGILNGYSTIIYTTYLQRHIAAEFFGRVMSMLMVASLGLQPLAQLIVGQVIERGALTSAFLVSASIMVMASASLWRLFSSSSGIAPHCALVSDNNVDDGNREEKDASDFQ